MAAFVWNRWQLWTGIRNRAGNRLKLLLWDGNDVWLCQRRLHHGSFIWPKVGEAVLALSQAQWQWLIAGVDWQR